MYGAMWRRLPGPWPLKAIESAVLMVGVVALLFVVVFPWAEPRLPFTDVTVDDEQAGADTVGPNAPDPTSTQVPTGDSPTLGAGATRWTLT